METKICAPRATGAVAAGEERKIIYGTDNPNHCYKTLPIEKFDWKNKSKGLRRHNCSSCRYRYDMRRYTKNPEAKQRRNEHAAKWMRKRRTQLRSKINKIKSSGCVDCGGTFHPSAMDFDHVRGTKKYGISDMMARRMGWDKIQKEIEKCEIRCANCHRIKSYEESKQRVAINNPVII
jgi:hypothetical protein